MMSGVSSVDRESMAMISLGGAPCARIASMQAPIPGAPLRTGTTTDTLPVFTNAPPIDMPEIDSFVLVEVTTVMNPWHFYLIQMYSNLCLTKPTSRDILYKF